MCPCSFYRAVLGPNGSAVWGLAGGVRKLGPRGELEEGKAGGGLGGGVGGTRATRWTLRPHRCGAVQPSLAGAAVWGASGGICSRH